MAKKGIPGKNSKRGKAASVVRAKTSDVKRREIVGAAQAEGKVRLKTTDDKLISVGSNLAREDGVVYGRARKAVLGMANNKPESQLTALEKMDIARIGVSKSALERLKSTTNLDYDQLASILSVARATLINKKGTEKFNSTLSEKIVGLADIYSYGYEVFEDEVRFNQWIFRPNQALNGQTPFDLIDNQFGREEVKDLIGRIDYGVYS